MEGSHEQLESNDGVDDDDEEDEEGDVHQGDDRHQDGIHHNLQACAKTAKLFARKNVRKTVLNILTWHARDQSERSQHSESSKGLHVEALNL